LKNEIAKVLLACAYVSDRCLVMVMKDVSVEPANVSIVSPGLFESGLSLWEAFSVLVTNVLLPLASLDIVHTDIRINPHTLVVYNILGEKVDESIELRLIDFESLVHCRFHRGYLRVQDFAISPRHLNDPSGLEFLFGKFCGWHLCGPKRQSLVQQILPHLFSLGIL
jgi:hypothetical protein